MSMTPKKRRIVAAASALLALAAAATIVAWPMDTAAYLAVRPSAELEDRAGRFLHGFLNADEQWCFERDIDDISPHLVQATIAAEDRRFYQHHGIDPAAILRALWQNLRAKSVVSGASTLTMQVAKHKRNDGVPRRRSLRAKAAEAIAAVRLDARVSKQKILRAYLNTAPYGANLVGCEAAARRYFGKGAKELSIPEAALLAALPKAPTRLMPLKHYRRARDRRNYVLRRMADNGAITKDELARAVDAPLGVRHHTFPTPAPHFAARFAQKARGAGRITTTLDRSTQERTAQLVRQALAPLRAEVASAAVVVIDVPTGAVRAYVGSGDFNAANAGQVDACRALRSPGSAVKPFTYALAIERDKLYTHEILLDDTLDYGLYAPDNFDGAFRGHVSAIEALRASLNVPAVTVLHRLGIEKTRRFYVRAGLSTVTRSADVYGLGLTLGNCEVRLEEIAAAYAMLARLGVDLPLTYFPAPSTRPARRCLSRGTCLEIYQMLERPLPGNLDTGRSSATAHQPRFCWKTGTSTRFRDAWAFVFNAHYAVGVWFGNPDGAPSHRLVGARTALPLAHAVFLSLPRLNAPEWPAPGNDRHQVRICAASGLPESQWCPATRTVSLPRHQYLHRRCDVHYPAAAGRVIERWPGEAKGWDLAHVRAPRPGPKRPTVRSVETLRITQPADGAEYVLTGEAHGDRIRLRASIDQHLTLYWYLDDRYLGSSRPGDPVYLDLEPGPRRIACMTPDGTRHNVAFTVIDPDGAITF